MKKKWPLRDNALAQRMDLLEIGTGDLARLSGVALDTVSAYRVGRRRPHLTNARKIATALDTTIEALWP